MKRSFLIGVDQDVTVTESIRPNIVLIAVRGSMAELTKEEFCELCDLRYKIDFVAEETPQPF